MSTKSAAMNGISQDRGLSNGACDKQRRFAETTQSGEASEHHQRHPGFYKIEAGKPSGEPPVRLPDTVEAVRNSRERHKARGSSSLNVMRMPAVSATRAGAKVMTNW